MPKTNTRSPTQVNKQAYHRGVWLQTLVQNLGIGIDQWLPMVFSINISNNGYQYQPYRQY